MKKLSKKLLTVLLALVLVVSVATVAALAAGTKLDVVYVGGTTGDDTNGTGAETKPVATMTKALELVKDGGKIVLAEDVTTARGTTVKVTKNVTIDLNGKTLKGPTDHVALVIGDEDATPEVNVTITDSEGKDKGKVTSPATGKNTINVWPNATLTINGANIEHEAASAATSNIAVIQVKGTETRPASVVIDGKDTTVKGVKTGVAVFAYGHLTVKNGEVSGTTFGIATNGAAEGDDSSVGAVITVVGGTVKGGDSYCGVYLPAGEMEVTGGTISGGAGIVVRGGDLEVSGGTVKATSKDSVNVGNAGHSVPAAGITVDNAGYPAQAGGQKHVTIEDGATIDAVTGGKPIVAADNGGTEVSAVSDKIPADKNYFDVQGGKLQVNGTVDTAGAAYVTQYLPTGYDYSATTGVTPKSDANFLVEIDGGMQYTTLADALKAATKGDTVRLLKDVDLSAGTADVEIDKGITLDLNGKTLTLPKDHNLYIVAGTEDVTIKDSKTGGTIKATFATNKTKYAITVDDNAELTFKSGTITVEGPTDSSNGGISVWKNSTLTVEGGTITGPLYGIATNGSPDTAVPPQYSGTNATVIVKGGTITGGGAGMYLPSQGGSTEISGPAVIKGTDGAGVVVRGGTLEISKDEKGNVPTIIAGGKDAQEYGAPSDMVPCAAVVLDLHESYGDEDKTLTITDGVFTAPDGVPSVLLVKGADIEEDTNDAGDDDHITITGGYYSAPVEDNYLDSTINARLESDNTAETYSYYTSKAAALAVDPDGEVELTEVGKGITSIEKFDVVSGAAAANALLNEELGLTGTAAIKDCGDNTMYVLFKIPTTVDDTYFKFTVYAGDKVDAENKVTEQANVTEITKPGMHAYYIDCSKLPGGVYTVELTSADNDDFTTPHDCGTATITVYKVTYEAVTGVTGDEEYFFTSDATDFAAAQKVVPDSFTLNSGVNKWTYGKQDMDKYNVIVRIGGEYSAPVDPGHKCPTKGFKDMEILDTSKLWYHEAMDYMVTNGYINGFENNTLQPNGTATRAQMWVIMAQTKGAAVAGNPWYKAAAEWAVKHEYSDGLRPNDYIQREEIVAILWRMADEPKSTQSLSKYSDAASVNDWAKTAMAWAVEKGIISGRTDANGKAVLVPQGIATRAELAVLIYNYVTLMK